MLKEKAYAKINLALDVIGKRHDGYHDLEMVMISVDLYDDLTFNVLNDDEIVITCNHPDVPTDERNLVHRAIRLMKEMHYIQEGVSVHIEKRIPVSAGLAGGSSNAAASIRAINRLFDLNLSLDEMYRIGEMIGSDVPFCVYGNIAFVTGRGEKIEPLPSIDPVWVVLVHPNIPVSTKEIFSNVSIDSLHHPSVRKVRQAIIDHHYDGMIHHMGNALEQVTFLLYPGVKRLKEHIQSLKPDVTLMSGSGPTLFALTQSKDLAIHIQRQLEEVLTEDVKIWVVNVKN